MKHRVVMELEIAEPNESLEGALAAIREVFPLVETAAPLSELDLIVRFGDEIDRSTFIMERSPPTDLEAHYKKICETPSDINEHLPYLRQLSTGLSECEFGCRLGSSTVALALDSKSFHSYDIDPRAVKYVRALLQGLISNPDREVNVTEQNTLSARFKLPWCDLLFIDSLHTYKQLSAELAKHHHEVGKYIAFHDTVTFGEKSEDGTTPGLRQAIQEFMDSAKTYRNEPAWKVLVDRQMNNGLMVIERT